MDIIPGHAAFIDILGMSTLTRGELELSNSCIQGYDISYSASEQTIHHHIAFEVLAIFRKKLQTVKREFKSVTFSQFSDCAFLWSKNVTEVFNATVRLMFLTLEAGLLCRAGISSGEILLPKKESKIGRFLAGSAITNAATNEKIGKGSRLFTDPPFVVKIGDYFNGAVLFNQVFKVLTIPTDYTKLDEIRWFFLKDFNLLNRTQFVNIDEIQKILFDCSNLISILMHSPKFQWNILNNAGRIQIAATIESIAAGMVEISKNEDFYLPFDLIIEKLKNRSLDALQSYKKSFNDLIRSTKLKPL
jgi:hypothetical protein